MFLLAGTDREPVDPDLYSPTSQPHRHARAVVRKGRILLTGQFSSRGVAGPRFDTWGMTNMFEGPAKQSMAVMRAGDIELRPLSGNKSYQTLPL